MIKKREKIKHIKFDYEIMELDGEASHRSYFRDKSGSAYVMEGHPLYGIIKAALDFMEMERKVQENKRAAQVLFGDYCA